MNSQMLWQRAQPLYGSKPDGSGAPSTSTADNHLQRKNQFSLMSSHWIYTHKPHAQQQTANMKPTQR